MKIIDLFIIFFIFFITKIYSQTCEIGYSYLVDIGCYSTNLYLTSSYCTSTSGNILRVNLGSDPMCLSGETLSDYVSSPISDTINLYKCTSNIGPTQSWMLGGCQSTSTSQYQYGITVSSSNNFINTGVCVYPATSSFSIFVESSNSSDISSNTANSKCIDLGGSMVNALTSSTNFTSSFHCPLNYTGSLPCTKISCATSNGYCGHGCLQYPNYYQCTCNPGWELQPDGKTCLDIDECASGISNCSYGCVNIPNSYYCICDKGYQLASDKKTCIDINECELNISNCSQICNNTIGGYYCTCKPGYELYTDNSTCIDYNECNDNNGNCSDKCYNTQGSYYCSCNEGYELKDKYNCSLPNITISSIIPSSTKGGLATFIGSFGIIQNDIVLLIDSVYCPVVSNSSNTITCTAKPGSGIHSITLKQNNNSQIFYGKNIYQYKNEIYKCPNNCSNQGYCNQTIGECQCYEQYTSFDCSLFLTNNQNNSTTEPEIEYNIETNSFKSKNLNFKIYYKELNEISIDGKIVKTFPLQQEWNIISIDSTAVTNNHMVFEQKLNNTNCTIITIIEEIKDKEKQINFANTNFKLEKGSIKLTINISNYEYFNYLNTLQLSLISSINQISTTSNNNCNSKDLDSQNINDETSLFTYIKISKDNQIFSGRFLNRLISDGRETFFSTNTEFDKLNSMVITTLNLPHFKESVIIDPDFSVLVSSDYKTSCDNSKSKKWLLPVVIIVPVVSISIVIVVFAIIYKKSIFLKKRVSKLKNFKMKTFN